MNRNLHGMWTGLEVGGVFWYFLAAALSSCDPIIDKSMMHLPACAPLVENALASCLQQHTENTHCWWSLNPGYCGITGMQASNTCCSSDRLLLFRNTPLNTALQTCIPMFCASSHDQLCVCDIGHYIALEDIDLLWFPLMSAADGLQQCNNLPVKSIKRVWLQVEWSHVMQPLLGR